MNRQFRRAQEKQDKKQDKEKAKRREERKSRLRQLRRSRAKSEPKRTTGDDQSEKKPASRGRVPGRFAGVLAAVTVFFIALQSVAPVEGQPGLAESLIGAGFYLMLGYFATLWFMRREVARAPLVSVIGGSLLAVSVTVVGIVQQRSPDLLSLALVVPALVVGAFLGRLVFNATPR
ncbi:MAG: hypothetical protein WD314_04170 [Trueperaceae bacterium]